MTKKIDDLLKKFDEDPLLQKPSSMNDTINVDVEVDENSDIYKEFLGVYEDFCKSLEDYGYMRLDTYSSDEFIIDHLELNECEYLEDGTPYNN